MSYPQRILLVAVLSVVFPSISQSAPRPAKPKPEKPADTPPAMAHVRFWKTGLPGFPVLRVARTGPGRDHPAGEELGGGGPGFLFANYIDVPAGACTLEVFDAPAPAAGKPTLHALLSSPADFSAGMFFTVLLSEPNKAGDPPRLEVIEDSGHGDDPANDPTQITVRNFVPGMKEMRVSIGDALTAQFVSGAGFLVMRAAKPAVYQAQTKGIAPDGKPFEWTNEMDLRQHHHQTLLIYPDSYGRIRPQVCMDGEEQVNAPENKEGQN